MVRPMHVRAVIVALVVSSATASSVARAEPVDASESARFRLFYEATGGSCPNAPAFLAAIRARTDRPRLAEPSDTATVIGVAIAEGEGGRVVGRLEIREPDGARQQRTVEGQACSDVAKALALIAALYLDPDATGTMEPEPEPGPSGPRSAPGPVHPESPAVPERPSPPAPPSSSIVLGAGAAGGVLGGIGPSIAPRAGGFVDAELVRAGRSWLRPAVRVQVDVATTEAAVAFGTQRYHLVAGAVRACPIQVPVVPVVRLMPCVGIGAGIHRGTSDGIPNARDQDKAWLAPSATAGLSWDVSPRLTLALEGGVGAPVQRTRFFLGPDITLFRTPAVTGSGGVAVRVRFL